MKFEESGLQEEVVKAILELGYAQMTPVQEQTIPFLMESQQDLIALAQTGTGKTAAFSLPVINQIDLQQPKIQCLILSPTRELGLQISQDIENYTKYLKKSPVLAVYGGADIKRQINGLSKNPSIVVGTPGRALDLINRGSLKINNIKWLVLDEADEMLSMGFKDDLDSILSNTPQEKQTLLFSATMPNEIKTIANKYMKNIHTISVVSKEEKSNVNIEHKFLMVSARDKYLALKRVMDFNPEIYGIVFCRTRQETKDIADKLIKDNYSADALHGDLSQAQRDIVMQRFKMKQIQVLVATDVAARGIDVNSLTHVINYGLPDMPEVYVHRSGRTGRAHNKGICVSILHSKEKGKLAQVSRQIGKKIDEMEIPKGKEICKKRLLYLIEKISGKVEHDPEIDEFLPDVYQQLEHISKEELIKNIVTEEFHQMWAYYKNAKDLTYDSSSASSSGRDRRGNIEEGFNRYFINMGRFDKVDKTEIIQFIDKTFLSEKQQRVDIGRVDMLDKFSFFEIKDIEPSEVLNILNGNTYNNREIRIEQAGNSQGGGGRKSGGGGYGRGGDSRPRNNFRSREGGGDRYGGRGGDRRGGGSRDGGGNNRRRDRY